MNRARKVLTGGGGVGVGVDEVAAAELPPCVPDGTFTNVRYP